MARWTIVLAALDLFLSICQAIGLAIAIGVGGTLVPVVAATLAHVDLGLEVEDTDWDFVADNWFVLALFALVAVELTLRRRGIGLRAPLLVYLTAAGALFGAASLAERGEPVPIGLIAGALAALLAVGVAGAVLEGAQRRVAGGEGTGAANALILIFAGAGSALAVASVLAPPVGPVALLALAVLAIRRRQRAGEKYEGLRTLR